MPGIPHVDVEFLLRSAVQELKSSAYCVWNDDAVDVD